MANVWFRIGFFWPKVWIFITDVGSTKIFLDNVNHKIMNTCKIPVLILFATSVKHADHINSNFLKVVFRKFYLVHFWMFCLKNLSSIFLSMDAQKYILRSCQKSMTEHSSKNSFSLQAAGVDSAFLIRSGPNSEFSCLI